MLPAIREQARLAFRGERPERRQELITEVVANCWMSYVRLIDRGLHDVIYATPLAQFAIKQVRDGRRVGGRVSAKDIGSQHAQRRHGFTVETLDCLDQDTGEWREILIEDRHAGPAETAAARIDVGDWFAQLPSRQRRIATTLASGESATNTARKYRVSGARISQLRREFERSWAEFQGEPDAA